MADETRTDDYMDEIAARAHRYYRDSRDHTSAWRQEAETAYDMVAGEQWDAETKMELEENRRPAVVFNRILRTINAILGTQVANRQETRFIPREIGDVQVNEVLSAAADWVRDECEAEDEESDAFEDMCVCGMGWTETRLDYETEPDGMVRIERIDPLEMYWDPGATKKNLSDARWVMRVRTMSLAEFQDDWPDANLETVTAPWDGGDDDFSEREHVYPQDAYNNEQGQKRGARGPKVKVAHVQWAESVDAYRIGRRAERVNTETFQKLQSKLEERSIPHMKQRSVVWKQAFIAGDEILDSGDCPFPNGPTLRALTYKRDRNRNTWYGIVKAMIDPQRYGNKFFSQILDILNKNAKGGILIEQDATDDIRKLEENWARPDAVHVLRSGAIGQGKIQAKPVAQWPAGLDRLMGFSMDAVHEVTGINLELLGFANREQAGVLEHQRKQAGLTIIAPLFDSMRRYRKEQGRVLLHFIQNYLSDGRLVRIVGQQGGEQYVPLAKQPEVAKYDVVVDEAPTSPNMREKVYASLVEIMPIIAKMGIPMPPELLDYAPIPSALASKWKELIEQSGGNPEQLHQQMQQMGQQMQKLQQENMQLKDKSQQSMAELQVKQQSSQADILIQREKVQSEAALQQQKFEQEMALKWAEFHAELELEKAKIAGQQDLKQQEIQANTEVKREAARHQRANGGANG